MRGRTIKLAGWRHKRFVRCAAVAASAGMALALGAPASVALARAPRAPQASPGVCAPGKTTENIFTRVTPLSGSTVRPGDRVGADFHDEHELNMTAPGQLQLTLTGPGGTTTLNPTITDEPSHTGGKTGEFKIVKRIIATLPSNPPPGSYTATIKGWDTDQTRAAGDCGTATWTFSVQPAPQGSLTGDIVLCASGVRVSGGTVSISGPQSRRAAPNPVSYSYVTPGSYVLAAAAPHGYHFVPCHGGATITSANAAAQTVSVPANGSGGATFFVDPNNVAVPTSTVPVTPAPRGATSPVARGAVKAAAVKFLPFTGRGELLVDAAAGLVLVVLGITTLLAVARSTRRA